MRDPKRIPTILQLFRSLWETYPDMRFAQLLVALAPSNDAETLFYMEDGELEKRMRLLLKDGDFQSLEDSHPT